MRENTHLKNSEYKHFLRSIIVRSFKPCALTFKNDGSEYNIIHYFKNGSQCLKGAFLLKDQVIILNNDDIVNCIMFEVTGSDVGEANTETNMISESDDENDFIDIE